MKFVAYAVAQGYLLMQQTHLIITTIIIILQRIQLERPKQPELKININYSMVLGLQLSNECLLSMFKALNSIWSTENQHCQHFQVRAPRGLYNIRIRPQTGFSLPWNPRLPEAEKLKHSKPLLTTVAPAPNSVQFSRNSLYLFAYLRKRPRPWAQETQAAGLYLP